ncbi:MAG: DNA polymerase/3'-5' exonuclease PolX [Bdellovibrionota bacterium]
MATNAEIADSLNEIATMLAIEGSNPFRIRAYENAARVIFGYPKSIEEIVNSGKSLPKIPGIGKDLEGKILALAENKPLPLIRKLEKEIPKDLIGMTKIPGLGPKRVRALHIALGITSFADLARAARTGQIIQVRGFGEKIQNSINIFLSNKALNEGKSKQKRKSWYDVREIAIRLESQLRAIDKVKRVEIAGSYRRKKDTVGDLDFLVTSGSGQSVIEKFTKLEEVKAITSMGTTKATVILKSGLQVDLRVVPEESYGAALHYFTGSKEHNIAIRHRGQERGLKINEYGVFSGGKRIAGKTESEVFRSINLPFIEPELRENNGEIEAAQTGKLPHLIGLEDIKGDLHVHTNATDGNATLREMVKAAIAKKYSYIAITDHSKRVNVANGLSADRLLKQIEEIDELQIEFPSIKILKGIEVDILKDGSLDLPDAILSRLDVRICAVHYDRNMSRSQMTDRIIRAMDNPLFNVLAHPTGRLIGSRDAYEVDLEKVIIAARDRGCYLEINCQPMRLDLIDYHCQLCTDIGASVSIATDSHDVNSLDLMVLGVNQARRGWVEKNDVLNALSSEQILSALNR